MEGACGKILETQEVDVIIKKVHRRKRAQQRTSSLRAKEQFEMQRWARETTKGMKILFVPEAWDCSEHEYKMKKIDVSKPLEESKIPEHIVLQELQEFYNRGKQEGIFPCDYELYEQPDGKVAMIDFDKFSSWKTDGSVEYPWGLKIESENVSLYLNKILGYK